MKTHSGFTLIEILVVMLIIGIAMSIAVVTVGSGLRHRDIINSTDELLFIFKLASDEAILQSTTLGLVQKVNGYEFYQYESGTTSWKPLRPDRLLGFRKTHEFINLSLYVHGKKIAPDSPRKIEPKLIFYNDGTTTPFYIDIGEQNQKPQYRLKGQSGGSLAIPDLAQSTS